MARQKTHSQFWDSILRRAAGRGLTGSARYSSAALVIDFSEKFNTVPGLDAHAKTSKVRTAGSDFNDMMLNISHRCKCPACAGPYPTALAQSYENLQPQNRRSTVNSYCCESALFLVRRLHPV
jgi:hypothetical protein